MASGERDQRFGDPEKLSLPGARRVRGWVPALPRQYGLMAAAFARALDRTRHIIKVSTGNAELARAAVLAHPYVVLDPNGDDRAVVCVGTICLAPVSTQAAIGEAIQEARQARA